MGFFSKSKKITEEQVKSALSQVIDPDLHKDIVSLGFVKEIDIADDRVAIVVELTTPACPAKEMLRDQCQSALLSIDGVERAKVEMTAQTRKAAAILIW